MDGFGHFSVFSTFRQGMVKLCSFLTVCVCLSGGTQSITKYNAIDFYWAKMFNMTTRSDKHEIRWRNELIVYHPSLWLRRRCPERLLYTMYVTRAFWSVVQSLIENIRVESTDYLPPPPLFSQPVNRVTLMDSWILAKSQLREVTAIFSITNGVFRTIWAFDNNDWSNLLLMEQPWFVLQIMKICKL